MYVWVSPCVVDFFIATVAEPVASQGQIKVLNPESWIFNMAVYHQ